MDKNVVVFGATSAIANATAKLYAEKGANLILIGRNGEKLKTIQDDLLVRGANACDSITVDLSDLSELPDIIKSIQTKFNKIDVSLIAHGTLPIQEECEKSLTETVDQITTNGMSHIAILNLLAPIYENQKSGVIACITSVAGDRGRQSNFTYGAAKSLVSTYLQGLTQKLSKVGVSVLDIKPGFVDTPMTAEFKKGALWAKPEQVGEKIYKSIESKKTGVIYVPFFWKFIMLIIKNIPNKVFNKISL